MTPSEIKSLRIMIGLSHREFAKALAFKGKNAHITVYRWEQGTRSPSQQTLELMKQLKLKKKSLKSMS